MKLGDYLRQLPSNETQLRRALWDRLVSLAYSAAARGLRKVQHNWASKEDFPYLIAKAQEEGLTLETSLEENPSSNEDEYTITLSW